MNLVHAAFVVTLASWFSCLPLKDAGGEESRDELARNVQEILADHCWSCHGERPKAKLDLRSVKSIQSHSVAVLEGMSSAKILQMISGAEPQMPKGRRPLSGEQVDVIRRWLVVGSPEFPIETIPNEGQGQHTQWWAFRPVKRPAVPSVEMHPIDAFVSQRQKALGVRPVACADRKSLIRRAYADLHGLPPTPEEVATFVNDPSSNAFENLVDRLLDSPRYGERWGRHWLDVVRYADTGGFETDIYFPNAWRYRDYVIQSLNDDKPFDQFVKEQIAGDELWPDDIERVKSP
jgi:mono/diheme cytochrome c family protein